jgi:hypothetical protein
MYSPANITRINPFFSFLLKRAVYRLIIHVLVQIRLFFVPSEEQNYDAINGPVK